MYTGSHGRGIAGGSNDVGGISELVRAGGKWIPSK